MSRSELKRSQESRIEKPKAGDNGVPRMEVSDAMKILQEDREKRYKEFTEKIQELCKEYKFDIRAHQPEPQLVFVPLEE